MFGLLVVVSLAASDAGTAALDVRRLVDDLMRRQTEAADEQRKKEVVELRRLAAAAPPAERALIERVAGVLDAPELAPTDVLKEFTAVLREAARLTRGRVDDERALGGAWLSLPALARNFAVDPSPYRREGLALIRDLVARYPKDGRVRGLLASALMESEADTKAILAALKRCAELDPASWCPSRHARFVADLERPRCSGKGLAKAFTATGAAAAPEKPAGAVLTVSGASWVLEAKPMLTNPDFAAILVTEDGDLSVDVTPAAASRLEQETKRLVKSGGAVVFKLGDETLLAARVMEPISGGRVLVARAKGRPFQIEELCMKPERPVVADELKLAK